MAENRDKVKKRGPSKDGEVSMCEIRTNQINDKGITFNFCPFCGEPFARLGIKASANMTKRKAFLVEKLNKTSSGQFAEIIIRSRVPKHELEGSSHGQLSISLVNNPKSQGSGGDFKNLVDAILAACPYWSDDFDKSGLF